MKKLNLGLLAMTGLLLSHSANAITVTGNATAIIKRNITATETQQMNFGTISTSGTAGTVTLSPAGARSSTLAYYGTSKAGVFTITGEPSTALTVSFGNGTLSNGANTMALTNFTTSSTPASTTTDSSGNLTLNVGADLAVAANQASGTYTGTYTVTISY